MAEQDRVAPRTEALDRTPAIRHLIRVVDRFLDTQDGMTADQLLTLEREIAAVRREAELWEAIDTEIKRLWKIAYEYDQHGEGTIGLLVDMTNAIGGLDSLRALLAAPGQADPIIATKTLFHPDGSSSRYELHASGQTEK